MAYATLAGVEPIYGLYSSFFAATCYMFFGTSRHVSVGTFAVASMMVGAVRFKLIPEQVDMDPHEVPNLTAEPDLRDPLRHIDVMTLTSTLTFAVGLVQLMMGILRLSFLTTYVTDPLIS
uniref:SLC26A/SulP transporter domain-containing protein n=1 Tax=Panagrolaimus sp. JU765 TaxID=591449 RepID=A0AC34RR03_9BILA